MPLCVTLPLLADHRAPVSVTLEALREHRLKPPGGRIAGCPQYDTFTYIAASRNRIDAPCEVELEVGDVCFLPGRTPLSAQTPAGRTLRALNLMITVPAERRAEFLAEMPAVVRAGEDTSLLRRGLEGLLSAQRTGNVSLARLEFMQVLLELRRLACRQRIAPAHLMVAEAIRFIHDQALAGVTRTAVARHCGLAPGYLSTLMQRETGRRFIDHVRTARIHAAIDLMTHAHLRIGEVAQALGLEPDSFSRMFKSVTGVAPREYCRDAGVDFRPDGRAGAVAPGRPGRRKD